MGALNSRLEEDQGVQLCRARKKFITQALNGRCSLASAHIAYIEHLGIIGSAFSGFVETDVDRVEVFPYSPVSVPPEQHDLVEKPLDRPSVGNMLPVSSPQVTSSFQSNAMRFVGAVSTKVEEKLPVAATAASIEADEVTPAWDYFGLFQHMDDHFSSQEWMGLEEEEGMPELEDVDEKQSFHGIDKEESRESEDEFDDPPSASLVRSFRNVNSASENVASETRLSGSDNVEKTGQDIAEGKSANGKNDDSLVASPLRDVSPRSMHSAVTKDCGVKDEVQPKDFFSSIRDIEQFFVKASESGKEVPRMLEANKFHFRLVKEGGSITSLFLKSCFSCGKDPSEVQQEAPQNSVKYLTWHWVRLSCSSSWRNPLLTNSTDYTNELNGNIFDNSCMVSGSHASTLDRLYAWEKKLYDEVKAGQVFQVNFDQKCKILRQKESRGESDEKTRAVVKDLHSRIRVAIHRINSISKKIEEIRDSELQPQLEELIEGLRKMWESMAQCHKLQYDMVSISHIRGATKMKTRAETIVHLMNELKSLSSALTKWITAQKEYVEAIDKWLFKCVVLPQNPTKRNKRMKPPPIRNCGPPIYMICGVWLEMIDRLPLKVTVESFDALAIEVAGFTPTNQDNATQEDHRMPNLDPLRTALVGFLGQLDKFAESCAGMFVELQKGIREAKCNYQKRFSKLVNNNIN